MDGAFIVLLHAYSDSAGQGNRENKILKIFCQICPFHTYTSVHADGGGQKGVNKDVSPARAAVAIIVRQRPFSVHEKLKC